MTKFLIRVIIILLLFLQISINNILAESFWKKFFSKDSPETSNKIVESNDNILPNTANPIDEINTDFSIFQNYNNLKFNIVSEPVYYFIHRPKADIEIISNIDSKNLFHKIVTGYTKIKEREIKLYEFEIFNNNIISVNIFNNSKKIKKTIKWSSDGKRMLEENYKNNESHGPRIEWYENGQKKSEENFTNGNRNGPSVYWHYNSKISCEENYSNGFLHGKKIKWHINGNPKSEEDYINGKKIGKGNFWDINGTPVPLN
ncbi:toxin-antitoxin system YwqK family antitoxin [Candidatus Dependentiae bacterium]|nr:toxin-antitoxin system YwqK family antitoxin [Candidatus Dependentiae bacterium]